jgi:hypothetical protein
LLIDTGPNNTSNSLLGYKKENNQMNSFPQAQNQQIKNAWGITGAVAGGILIL